MIQITKTVIKNQDRLILNVNGTKRVMTGKQITQMFFSLKRGATIMINKGSAVKIQERTRNKLLYALQEYRIKDLVKTLTLRASEHTGVPVNKIKVTIEGYK